MANDCVIYISSHNVQVIQGSCDKDDMIKIDDFEEYPLEEGAMINGVITDDQSIKDVFLKIRDRGTKEARLVIDSGQILSKNVTVPILSKKELLQITKDELAGIEGNYEDLIYDYCVLQDSFEEQEGGEILCCAVERKLLSSYMDIFQSAGIKIKSIGISLSALHKLTQELVDLDNKTYIVVNIDGSNVSSFLFENNHYTFSNRSRIFSERGTAAFITEMNSNISQMIQFNKSKHSAYNIEVAYFCGLADDEELLVFPTVKDSLQINAETFPDSKMVYITNKQRQFLLHDYIFAVGCMIRK